MVVTIGQNRSDAIGHLTADEYNCLVIDDSYSIKDIEILLKYLNSNHSTTTIFFISKDFSLFKDVLYTFEDFKLNLIDAPIETKELSETIMRSLFTMDHSTEVDRQVRMNIQFLKIFTDATKKILSDFCGLQKLEFQKPQLLKKEGCLPYAIRGQIELKSDLFQGTYIIHFDQRTYLKIVNRLLSSNDKDINDENKDFAGEIVNMIYGQAKIDLNLAGYNFEKSFPKFEVMPYPLKPVHPMVQLIISSEEGEIEILIEIKKMQGYVL